MVRTGLLLFSALPLVAACASPPNKAAIAPSKPLTSEPVPAPSLSHKIVRATGIGRPPPRMKGARAKLMARRAAEVVAVRNLARELGHERQARIRGFRYASTEYLANGSVKVTVEYQLHPKDHAKKDPAKKRAPQRKQTEAQRRSIRSD